MSHAKLTVYIMCAICALGVSVLYSLYPLYQSSHQAPPANHPIVIPYTAPQPLDLTIQLPNLSINPILNQHPPVDPRLENQFVPEQDRLYLAQYKQNTHPPVATLAYFPQNTYLIHPIPNQLNQLLKDPNLNFLTDFHPAYKIDTDIAFLPTQETLNLFVILDPSYQPDSTTDQILQLSADINITEITSLPGQLTYNLQIPSTQLIPLAQLPQVIWIQPSSE